MRLALCLTTLAAALSPTLAARGEDARPNIVWILVDDMSAQFSCYGETLIRTPNVDRLAREGARFAKTFVTAPVCSPCRSALITGMYQTSIGAQNHRSGRGTEKILLPDGVEPIPALLRRQGYYTAIGSAQGSKLGKTDYNFEWDPAMYDGADWSGRKPGQPFFMQVQLHGGKLRENANWRNNARKRHVPTDADAVTLPPYYPRDPVILEDWAAYLDAVRQTDREVGDVLNRLEREGILDQTVVMFMTDHGISHARGKQFLYDEGIHVPLVVRGPGIPAGTVRDDLVSHIDLAATSLALARAPIPASMQAHDLFAKDYRPRDAVFSARDRCDETVDHIRSVRTDRFKYIRNFLPERPMLQPNRYKDAKPILRRLRELHAQGKLDELQERLLFSPTRPKEELYDLQADPHELRNLADDPAHRDTLEALRKRLDDWIVETNDRGAQPESAAMFDSDMKVYLDSQSAAEVAILQQNIATMKTWAAEGK
ncbi:sulfatase family protein [Paludisphaera soli]|uniref:sulfatase family protein n=1 Tax=Paludisphaera soli TaxID=2712865 RepID=UPI0013EB54A2|nr:sulfatase [Paludisphaera soli]